MANVERMFQVIVLGGMALSTIPISTSIAGCGGATAEPTRGADSGFPQEGKVESDSGGRDTGFPQEGVDAAGFDSNFPQEPATAVDSGFPQEGLVDSGGLDSGFPQEADPADSGLHADSGFPHEGPDTGSLDSGFPQETTVARDSGGDAEQ